MSFPLIVLSIVCGVEWASYLRAIFFVLFLSLSFVVLYLFSFFLNFFKFFLKHVKSYFYSVGRSHDVASVTELK